MADRSDRSEIRFFQNRVAVLATMHGKEQAIAPILESEFGLKIQVPAEFDTDRFGTFTREIDRSGTQLEAARKKSLDAIAQTGADLAIASEGSFAPHPAFPMLAYDRELVILIDVLNGLEIVGEAISTETNFNHCRVSNFDQANQFAIKIGFPEHKLIVMVHRDSTDPNDIFKSIADFDQLREIVAIALDRSVTGTIHLETDMRAMHNPSRMHTIAQATRDLAEKLNQCCPNCSIPGFTVVQTRNGLLCRWCGEPTDLTLSEICRCQKCGFEQENLYPNQIKAADPMYCPACNP
ncbi:MAG TPA: DUF6671 family protein [Leptolyngbya sp.]|jgi:hypothetical protein|nr:DUF6671 family protein [Leptolyngbya sp.]